MVQACMGRSVAPESCYLLSHTPICRCVVLIVNAEFGSTEGLEECSSHLGLLHLAEAVIETLIDHIRPFCCDEETVYTAKAHRLR